jgi:class 3 adenylate cyclase
LTAGAARLCGAARADTILASREALEASGRQVGAMQKLVLKGIAEPVEAAEIRWER